MAEPGENELVFRLSELQDRKYRHDFSSRKNSCLIISRRNSRRIQEADLRELAGCQATTAIAEVNPVRTIAVVGTIPARNYQSRVCVPRLGGTVGESDVEFSCR